MTFTGPQGIELHALLKAHLGHAIECVTYGDAYENIALECGDCMTILVDANDDGGAP